MRGIDERNTRMVERIAVRLGQTPPRSYFFAVGAAHFVGETGILSQLTKRNFKVTRLGPRDAGRTVRKPAA
jgi:uncharacterized protein YbaP (TraB family)